ncbi:heterogeneous nuclear ribonucleoprotein Q isoform X15 [Drosophila pseudoobscura]|uniref:Heterogeneous nuclear ribonucleoprotein Q isoform X15 n=1 Tax=Drosophila pseudoobscura pseudoobscura TaxID=46245 RepID=A0A6I8VDJ5_DROPS|nr:heterogeneous nuclear ribonucleoprotein Q isoform X15 [Drosophila pseudoobscura]
MRAATVTAAASDSQAGRPSAGTPEKRVVGVSSRIFRSRSSKMAEGNGELLDDINQKADDRGDGERTEDYPKLLEYGLDKKVAGKLDEIYKTGKLAHAELDERALDALKEFPVEGALNVLGQFLESNLEHVSNKSAYLCGVMKTYRQKSRASQQGVPAPATAVQVKGPDEDKIKKILERTGYTLDVTTGQRKYGGPPPDWEGNVPGNGCEVFCGKIPKDMYEDELIPLFENCGTIWDLRLMMDPMTGTNRGYAFVTFTNRDAAVNAVRQLDNHEIKPGKCLKINISVPNLRLFVGNIPKSKGKDEILEEFGKLTAGLYEVIIYSSPDDKKKNRGFCFLEYESHKAASLAKRRLGTGRIKVWGCDIIVDWADPQEEPDEQTMSKVKVLYVRNLTQDVTEEKLKEQFEQYGKVERVKKIKDYAFIHFEDRDSAVEAMRGLNGKEIGASNIEVSLAKPPSDKKKKEEILRARERRMMQMMQARPGLVGFETLSPYRNLSPTHPSMMSLTPMRLPGARMPLRTPIPREYGGWSWAWNHSAAWQSRWPAWQHQSSGGPNSATGGGTGSGGGGGGTGGGGSSAGGHRSGGAGSNRGGPWGGTNASQRSWHPARQAATKFTSWSHSQDVHGGQLSVAPRPAPRPAARLARLSRSPRNEIAQTVGKASIHTSIPKSVAPNTRNLGPKRNQESGHPKYKYSSLIAK